MQNVGNAIGVAVIGVLFYGAVSHGFADAFEVSVIALAVRARRRRRPDPAHPGAGTLVMVTVAENRTVRIGPLLRDWRQRRRMSQMELALEAGVSTRHLSFVETGRSRPSAEMVLHLAERLEVPLRERNELLLAAGFAPQYSARDFDDPALREVRDAVSRVLAAHEPYPAIAVDRYWNLVASNEALGPMLEGVAPELLVPPVNTIRLALHPTVWPRGSSTSASTAPTSSTDWTGRLGSPATRCWPSCTRRCSATRAPRACRSRWTPRSPSACDWPRRRAPTRPAVVLQHHHHVRDRRRCDGVRAVGGGVLPRRRRDGRVPARRWTCVI